MAKQRRHQSSIPKSNQKYGIGEASRAAMLKHGIKTEREYITKAVKQREDGLLKHEPPSGGTSSTKWKDDGGVVKTLYSADGTLDRTVEISSTGTTTTWIPLEITNAETFDATASGTVDIGCGPMAFVANTSICDDYPFMACCPDEPSLCCLESLEVTGTVNNVDVGECGAVTGTLSYSEDPLCGGAHGISGLTEANGYFVGTLTAAGSSVTALVWCSGSTAAFRYYDPAGVDINGCPLTVFSGTVTNFTCSGPAFDVLTSDDLDYTDCGGDPGVLTLHVTGGF